MIVGNNQLLNWTNKIIYIFDMTQLLNNWKAVVIIYLIMSSCVKIVPAEVLLTPLLKRKFPEGNT